MLTDLLIPIIGNVSAVVTEAVSPVISFVKSSPVADALLRKVPVLELVVAVNVSVDDPDALIETIDADDLNDFKSPTGDNREEN